MKILRRNILMDFASKHPDCRKWIAQWLADASSSIWKTSQDIKARYQSASFLPANIVIFNVRGNSYRMEVQVAYKVGVVTIKWIGTHDAYMKRIPGHGT